MDITPLLCVGRMLEQPLLLLFGGLLATISTISTIPVASMIDCVDFPIVLLLLWGPLAVGLKKLSPGLRSLNAYVSDCEQIGHHFLLLHGYLLHSLDIDNPVMEDIDDFDALEALIMLLLDGLRVSIVDRCLYVP
jgi:hypothetical protein